MVYIFLLPIIPEQLCVLINVLELCSVQFSYLQKLYLLASCFYDWLGSNGTTCRLELNSVLSQHLLYTHHNIPWIFRLSSDQWKHALFLAMYKHWALLPLIFSTCLIQRSLLIFIHICTFPYTAEYSEEPTEELQSPPCAVLSPEVLSVL